ncbi:cysteine desulfurase family protein [Demequina pelophila]|uniref:cysteine desulfurase family protein n=1 Tax=Demequina pelophila TaxID=1638984 RepID=UPI000780C24F|nr:cysteine desulfurase family protein [Demequina pelophila]
MTYLDHAATTPVRRSAREAWLEACAEVGNPSSTHAAGRRARALLEDARERIAAALGAHPTEVTFTSGATEADNLALKGLMWAAGERGTETGADARRTRAVTAATEHHAGLDPLRWLEARGEAQVVELPVSPEGRVETAALAAELAAHADATALVSLMWANNEIGVVQDIAALAAVAAEHGVPMHTDAVQAVAYLPVDFAASGCATMAVTAHKLGGPVGIGALLARRGVRLEPLLHGGGQQGARSGTLDAAGAQAFAVALEEAVAERSTEARRLRALQDHLLAGLIALPGVRLTGPQPGESRLPGLVSVVVDGATSEGLLTALDMAGVCASGGSACSAGVLAPSHVLTGIGLDERTATGALRLSMGHTSTREDVDAALAVLPGVIARSRAAAAV